MNAMFKSMEIKVKQEKAKTAENIKSTIETFIGELLDTEEFKSFSLKSYCPYVIEGTIERGKTKSAAKVFEILADKYWIILPSWVTGNTYLLRVEDRGLGYKIKRLWRRLCR